MDKNEIKKQQTTEAPDAAVETVKLIDSPFVPLVINGDLIIPIDDSEQARRHFTRRGYKLINKYRKYGRSCEVWGKRKEASPTSEEARCLDAACGDTQVKPEIDENENLRRQALAWT